MLDEVTRDCSKHQVRRQQTTVASRHREQAPQPVHLLLRQDLLPSAHAERNLIRFTESLGNTLRAAEVTVVVDELPGVAGELLEPEEKFERVHLLSRCARFLGEMI